MDVTAWTADNILGLPQYLAPKLFGNEPEQTFRQLVKRWHPDTCSDPQAQQVFTRILALRESDKNGKGQVTVIGSAGEERVHLTTYAETDLGRRWVGPNVLAWSFEHEPDLAKVFRKNLRETPFADEKMRKQMCSVFPRFIREVTHDGAPMLMFPRKNTAVISDWIVVQGSFPTAHLAWLGSGLLNIGAWANWADWVRPAIALDTVTINPATHDVGLVGGWESAAQAGKRPVVASKRTLRLCPALTSPSFTPTTTLTQEIIRQTLREAAGDPSGLRLTDLGVPGPIAKWLQSAPAKDAVADYQNWHQALQQVYGTRKFVKWDKSISEVYSF